MPGAARIWVIPEYPKVARRAVTLVADDARLEGRMLASQLRNTLKMRGSDDSVGVFNRDDYVAAGGAAFADLAESILRPVAG